MGATAAVGRDRDCTSLATTDRSHANRCRRASRQPVAPCDNASFGDDDSRRTPDGSITCQRVLCRAPMDRDRTTKARVTPRHAVPRAHSSVSCQRAVNRAAMVRAGCQQVALHLRRLASAPRQVAAPWSRADARWGRSLKRETTPQTCRDSESELDDRLAAGCATAASGVKLRSTIPAY